jgi:F-type H+-transporting ATPase subunit a
MMFFEQEAVAQQDTLTHAAATAAAPVAAEQKGDIFKDMLKELRNNQEWSFGPFGSLHLPYLFYDTDGFHYYGSDEALESSHQYTLKEEKPVRVSDGMPPKVDLSISRNVALMWVVGAALIVLFSMVAKKYKKSIVPKGFANLLETLIVFIRDEVVVPTSGEVGRALMPFFLTLFFFILLANLLGLIPFGHTATGDVSVTAGLALIAFVLIQITHVRENGIKGYLNHLTGGVHWLMWPIMVPVEFLGLFTKPFALCIRLFANMTAGHVVILSLLGLIFFFKTIFVAPLSVGFALFINLLELLVAFIQAYIFTMLTSLFIGIGLPHEHAHHEEAAHAKH